MKATKKQIIIKFLFVLLLGIGTMVNRNVVLADDLTETSGSCGDNCTYTFDSATGTLTISGTGEINNSFKRKENIKIIVVNSGVTSIGEEAFYNCTGLTSITIPDSVTSIGDRAFYLCKGLTSISIDGVNSIGESAFYYCKELKSITIPSGVTSICKDTFKECAKLSQVTFSEGLVSIGDYAFYNCKELTEIMLPKGLETIGEGSFLYTNLSEVVIPEGVSTIGADAFGDSLQSITLPDSLTSIGGGVASLIYCSDELVNKIDGNWKNIYWVITPSTRTVEIEAGRDIKAIIDANTFTLTLKGNGELYSDFYIPSKYIYLKKVIVDVNKFNFWKYGYIETAEVLDNVTSLSYGAFYGCSSLKTVKLPNGLKSIETIAFDGCSSLDEIVIPDNVEYIGSSAFYDCKNLKSITLPKKLTRIESDTFGNCSELTEIDVPDGVSAISERAFTRCTKLEKIIIPESVTSISSNAFEHCDNLTIYCVEGSAAEKFAIDNNYSYVSSKSTKPKAEDETKTDTQNVDKTENNADISNNHVDKTENDTDISNNQSDNVTVYNIKKNKTYKKTKKIKISDADGIKSIKLNKKNIKFKTGSKNVSFKLSKYKKYLKKKKKANTLVVIDVNGTKSSIKFKTK